MKLSVPIQKNFQYKDIGNWRKLEMLADGKAHSAREMLTSVLDQGPAMGIECSMNIVK